MSQINDPLGLVGTVIGDKYRVRHAVAQGGYAVVYRADHLIWREPVALKCFSVLASLPEDQRAPLLEDFLQEGRLMSALSSECSAVLQARDVGTLTTPDGKWVPYMVLEWIDGLALDEVLAQERDRGIPPRSLPQTLRLLAPVAEALATAHARGIAHRDVKPENVLLVGDPARHERTPPVKLLDFGVAKVMAERSVQRAQTGSLPTSFTPRYGAPEQFNRRYGATGPWTDVYALALLVMEVMRGDRVIPDDDYVRLAIASSDEANRPTPRANGLTVTDAVEAIFAAALAVDPAARPSDAAAFWSLLIQAAGAGEAALPRGLATWQLARARAQHADTTDTPMAAPLSEDRTPTPLSSTDLRRGGRRFRGGAWMAGAALVAAAFGAGILLRPAAGTRSAEQLGRMGIVVAPSSAATTPAPLCAEEMTLVPGGRFFMGSDDAAFKLWQPAHKVALDAFCMDVTEVTTVAYAECVQAGGCTPPAAVPDYPKSAGASDAEHDKSRRAYGDLCNAGHADRRLHPINCVSWEQASAHCRWRSARLPTEAEWEYAARGSDGRTFPWGDEPGGFGFMNACGSECSAWQRAHGVPEGERMYETDDGWAGTAPVGSFPRGRTRFGLDDMVGNVWEWTADWFVTYTDEEQINPRGAPAGERKAIRGGGFNGGVALWHNPAFRYHQLATASSPAIGFRCAASVARP